MTPIVLFGIGSGIVVDVIESCRRAGQPIAAYIHNRDVPHFLPDGLVPTSLSDIAPSLRSSDGICPLFTPANRLAAAVEAQQLGFSFNTYLIDPTAITASDLRIGGGSFVNAGVIIGAAAVLGRNVFINRGASLGHHNEIGDFVSVGPGAVLAGQVVMGQGSMIGAGAVVGPGVRIGAGAMIGAGALVLRDVPAHHKAIGSPARVLASTESGFDDAQPR